MTAPVPDVVVARRFLSLIGEEAPAFCFQTATDDLKVKATYPIWPTGWPNCWLPARRPEFADRSTAPRLIGKVTKYRRVTRRELS